MTKNAIEKRRVVVTGLGVVSSIGVGWQKFWPSLLAGESGISRISGVDTSGNDRHYGGEVKNFNALDFVDKEKAKTWGRASLMLLAAAKMALSDAKIALTPKQLLRTALCVGTTTGEIGVVERIHELLLKDGGRVCPSGDVLFASPENLAVNLAVDLKLRGIINVFSAACAAGNYSIGRGFDLIQSGQQDFAIVGGADGFSRIIFNGFERLHAVAPERCRPFDKNRDGMIPGEGAGVLFLETVDNARARKVPIYAEVVGYGLSCDAHNMTIPSDPGVAKSIRQSLRLSNCPVQEVDYFCAHGTGTKENDKTESQAIRNVFGHLTEHVAVSSIKSALGHTMGAASAIEAIACCLAIKQREIPPTINWETADPDCNVDCTPNVSRKRKLRFVLNNAQAFGGNNACVVFKEFA